MNLVVFLQNAWAYDPEHVAPDGIWHRERWLAALWHSHTGRRLAYLLGPLRERAWVDNTTPAVGDSASSRLPPDEGHIRAVLESVKPDRVLACGRQAEEALGRLWDGPLLCTPHPASHVLTNALLDAARELLLVGRPRRVALRQRRGGFEHEVLDGDEDCAAAGRLAAGVRHAAPRGVRSSSEQ